MSAYWQRMADTGSVVLPPKAAELLAILSQHDDYLGLLIEVMDEASPSIDIETLARAMHEVGGEFCSPFATPEQTGWPGGHPVAMHNSQAAALLGFIGEKVRGMNDE